MKKSIYLFLLIFGNSFYAQNKVEKSKNELNSSPSENKTLQNKTHDKSSSDSDNSEENGEVVEFFITIFGAVFKYVLIGDYNNEEHLYNKVAAYPFYNSNSGNYSTSEKNKFRIDLEDKFIYSNNDLFGNHLNVKIRPFQYFYLQTDFHQIFEINRIDNTNNRLSLFHFNLCYDRVRFEKFDLGWNIGASYIGNEVRKGAFSYGLSANYFMNKSFSFSGNAKWSKINKQPVNAFEFQGKFHRKNYFFTLGFEHLKIATPIYNFIALGGGIYL
jgi:hypothetical protein